MYGEEPLTAGEHQVRVEFAYDGGGLGKGGTATLYLDGEKVGEAGSRRPSRWLLGDETTDIGSDTATPVTDDLEEARRTSRAASAGCRSTSATTPRTPTT